MFYTEILCTNHIKILLKNLVIDIGNSNIKYAESLNGNLSKSKFVSYDKDDFERKISALLLGKNKYDLVGISGSNTKRTFYLEKKYRKDKNILLIKRDSILPIRINYSKTLGTDRICAALGAVKKYPLYKNILVIDFGTATTYNLISNRIFIGGLITPGIKTALKSLINNTSLPYPNLKYKKKLYYKNTIDNISNGVILQSLFFTERIVKEYKKEFKNLYVIATGGDAGVIFPITKLINKKETDLNLEGLNYFLGQNNK